MTHITAAIEIQRPAEETFAFISRPENNPRWQQGMVEARVTSSGSWGVGSTYEQVARFLGRRIESSFEIVAFEPGRLIKGTTTAGSFPITFTRIVEPTGAGCRVTAIVEGDASGFFRLFQSLLDGMVRRSVEGDYRRLKQLLEGQSQV